MTGLQFTVAAALAPHLDAALRPHLRRLREAGIAVPADLEDLAEWARVVLRGLKVAPADAAVHDAPMPVLLSLADAARELGCSPSTVKRLIAAGQLVAVDFNGRRRVRRVDLDAFVDQLGPSSFRSAIVTKESS